MDLSQTPPDYNPFDDPPASAAELPSAAVSRATPARPVVPLLAFSLVCAVAAILVGWLLIRTGRLQAQVTALRSQAVGFHVISATYGSGGNFAEVTARVAQLLQATNAEFWANPNCLGTDPSPGWNKQLTIIYVFQGKRHLFTTGEGGHVSAAGLREVDGH